VGREVCDKVGLDLPRPISRTEAMADSASSTDWTFMYFRTKVLLKLTVVVKVEILKKIANTRLLSVYKRRTILDPRILIGY
jgi:hypothetical protein